MNRTLDDIFVIPESVQAGDWVTVLNRDTLGDIQKLLDDYVVTDQLAACFDDALELVRNAVTTGFSQAGYVDGSFGAGKSHFLGILKAVLQHHPDARGKKGLSKVIADHDEWLSGKRFLQITQHVVDAPSLEAAILGRYVDIVREIHPDKPLPNVYRSDQLIADAQAMRQRRGDDEFIDGLFEADADSGSSDSIHDEWGESNWDGARLDAAFAAAPGSAERDELVAALVGPGAHFASFHDSIRGTEHGFIDLDTGLSRISKHAKDVLGYDAIILHLDETVLWLQKYVGDTQQLRTEAQKFSKLVESAETNRPAPIVSFVPRQRDLSQLVGKGDTGAEIETLFDTLKYWDGRFQSIELSDQNLPTVIQERLLRPRDGQAARDLDAAFAQTAGSRGDIWDTLLDAQGEPSTKEQFRKSYPFSPAFLHIMVEVSGSLQRTRSALKLMSEMLGEYRRLPVGSLMPVGAVYQRLLDSANRPFYQRLKDEFEKTKTFYQQRLLPYLCAKHSMSETDVASGKTTAAFDADTLIVKTLLLSAIAPVPALQGLTASRLHALNLGAVTARVPGTEVRTIAQTLRDLGSQFGDFHIREGADPRVDVNLIGIDTHRIIQQAGTTFDTVEERQRKLRQLLWEELGLADDGTPTAVQTIIWRGTERTVEVMYGNIREQAGATFHPDRSDAIKVLIDYPFDTGNFGPSDDRGRVNDVAAEPDSPKMTFAWLPSFFQHDRLHELGQLVIIDALLQQDRLAEYTRNLTSDERVHARSQLESRRSSLTTRIKAVLKQAYGVASVAAIDVEAHDVEHFHALDQQLTLARPSAGTPLKEAFTRACHQLLAHAYPTHPDLDPEGTGRAVRVHDINRVLSAVERAGQSPDRRLELEASEKAVLRRIANPLEIATVGEVFVLRQDWQMRLDRVAVASNITGDVTIRQVRGWINDEVAGLVPQQVDLVVHVYANLTDRNWMLFGKAVEPQPVGKLNPDTVLRKPELPPRDVFDLAAQRAAEIFGAERRVAYTSRSARILFNRVRECAQQMIGSIDALRSELEKQAVILGLNSDSDRLSIVRQLWTVLNDLVSKTDATPLLRELADAVLPADAPKYKHTLTHANRIVEAMHRTQWSILGGLAGLSTGDGDQAEAAASILRQLRDVASRNEIERPLGPALDQAVTQASALITAAVSRPTVQPPQTTRPTTPPAAPPPARPNTTITRLVTGSEAEKVLAELSTALDANPYARFEITWRKVE